MPGLVTPSQLARGEGVGVRGTGDWGPRVRAPRVPGYTPSPHSLLRPACFFDACWGRVLAGHLATPRPPRVHTTARRAARKGVLLEQAPRTTHERSARRPAAPPAPSRKSPAGLRMLAPPPACARVTWGGPLREVPLETRAEAAGSAPRAGWRVTCGPRPRLRSGLTPCRRPACSLGMTARTRHHRSPEHGAD